MIHAFLKKTRKFSTYHLKELEKEQTKPKVSRRKEELKNNRKKSIKPKADSLEG